MNENRLNATQEQLDHWRAFCEQTRTDMFTLGQLVAGGQREAAQTLIAAVRTSAIVCGLDMESAGAARPDTLPPRPEGGFTRFDDDDEDQ